MAYIDDSWAQPDNYNNEPEENQYIAIQSPHLPVQIQDIRQ